ncbi:TetR/AcrR family transcriptional regulator [Ensifer adhaerens]|uniref:TetR/AcrR family transcriptional regulator n=1 Tax=Ensifer adhaerens TaxID=106592 RepID=UPI003D001F0B
MAKKQTRVAGRPAGSDSTRSAILKSARDAFATAGYSGASIRAIATEAGVDPSTVIHFFTTKDGLFQAVIQDVAQTSAPLLEALRNRASGTELVKTYLTIWDNAESGPAMQAIIRTSFSSTRAMELFRATQTRSFLEAVASVTKDPLSAELVMMQLIAIGMGRFIAALPELSSQPIDVLAERVGPLLDQYLA